MNNFCHGIEFPEKHMEKKMDITLKLMVANSFNGWKNEVKEKNGQEIRDLVEEYGNIPDSKEVKELLTRERHLESCLDELFNVIMDDKLASLSTGISAIEIFNKAELPVRTSTTGK